MRSSALLTGLMAPVRDTLLEAGELGRFSARALRATTEVWRYASEVLRQCAILVLGSSLIITFLVFLAGSQCGLESVYLTKQIGAQSFAGSIGSLCTIREIAPYMLGYIFSAKVGCGLVAEIGAMRIRDELDAMSVLAIDPMRYVVATRLLAVWLVLPLLYLFALMIGTFATYVVIVVEQGAVSRGTFSLTYWGFVNSSDMLFSSLKAFAMVTVITLTGLFYGYRVRGGPVAVGAATARSMIFNLVAVHVIGSLGTLLFFGSDTRMAIGG